MMKDIVENIFVSLSIITAVVFVYKHFRPYALYGLEANLLSATIISGGLWLMIRFLPRRSDSIYDIRRPSEISRKAGNFFREIRFSARRLAMSGRHSFRYDRGRFMRPSCSLPRLKLSHAICVAGLAGLSAFYYYIYPMFSFDEFMFFVLLLYIPFSLVRRLDSRIPVGFAIILLAVCPVLLIQDMDAWAERAAIYVYYFLVIGVILMLLDFRGEKKEEKFGNCLSRNRFS